MKFMLFSILLDQNYCGCLKLPKENNTNSVTPNNVELNINEKFYIFHMIQNTKNYTSDVKTQQEKTSFEKKFT